MNARTEAAHKATDAARKQSAEGQAIVEQLRRDLAKRPRPRSVPVIRKPPTEPSLIAMVEHILKAEREDRPVVAALGLVKLREVYEDLDTRAGDSWEEFVTKYLGPALGLNRIDELIGWMVHRGELLRCTRCSAEAKAGCACGQPYVGAHRWAAPAAPKERTALERAAAAVAANPEKSNRAIAEEIGVGDQTVRRAREKVRSAMGHGAVDGAVDMRVGRDGRRRLVRSERTP
jgi:hypothetical protein